MVVNVNFKFEVFFKVPKLLQAVTALQIEDEMPCFDPEDVIFVTNKWDDIKEEESDSDEEPPADKIWREFLLNVEQEWPCVKKRNIFRMNILEVKKTYFVQSAISNMKLTLISLHVIIGGGGYEHLVCLYNGRIVVKLYC